MHDCLGFRRTILSGVLCFKECSDTGTASTEYTMIADVALARTFGITLQELPSCSRLLEARPEDLPSATILNTELTYRQQ